MVRSPGQYTVTLLKAVPAVLAGDLGVATGASGDVLQLPYRDALALVQGGYARFESAAKDAALEPTVAGARPRAIQTGQVAVGVTAVLLANAGDAVAIQAPSAATLYIGAAGVTTATGWPIAAGQTISLDRETGEDVYGILATGTGTAYVMRTGV